MSAYRSFLEEAIARGHTEEHAKAAWKAAGALLPHPPKVNPVRPPRIGPWAWWLAAIAAGAYALPRLRPAADQALGNISDRLANVGKPPPPPAQSSGSCTAADGTIWTLTGQGWFGVQPCPAGEACSHEVQFLPIGSTPCGS